MSKKTSATDKQYQRGVGQRDAVGLRVRTISFSWEKLDPAQGQTPEEWQAEGLLAQFCRKTQQIGQYSAAHALAQQLIKQYTQVGFPPNSEFDIPRHVTPTYWAVIHITPTSKEVVAGYIENEVFYIVFLDKEHKFWPTSIQNKGKNKR